MTATRLDIPDHLRPRWSQLPRRAAYAGVLLLGIAALTAWIWLPMRAAAWAAAHGAWPFAAYGIAFAVLCSLLAETGNMLLRARAIVPVTTTVHYLRSSTGGTWWEAGSLVAHEDDPVSAGRLVHHALLLADAHEAGLAVVPNSPATHRAYLRRGFTPGPLNPRILIRPPHAHTPAGHPGAAPLA